jgi:hypothetical protein
MEFTHTIIPFLFVAQQNCSRIFLRAQRDLVETQDWTFASKHFGVTTHYRREADGSLSIKLEGDVEASGLFEQICVLREVDLHYRWSPLCNSSLKIADIDKLDGVGWFVLGLPSIPLARDGCFRAIGCDNILEDGSIIIAGQGIQDIMPGAPPHEDPYLSSDPLIQNLNIPPSTLPQKNSKSLHSSNSFFSHNLTFFLGSLQFQIEVDAEE